MQEYQGYKAELAELKTILANLGKTSSYIQRRMNYITNKLTEYKPPQTIEEFHNSIELYK